MGCSQELKYAETADGNYATISFSGRVASISNGENKLMASVSNGSGGVKGTVTFNTYATAQNRLLCMC